MNTTCLITASIAAREFQRLLGTDLLVNGEQASELETDSQVMRFSVRTTPERINAVTVRFAPCDLLLSLDDFSRFHLAPAAQDHREAFLSVS